jgi:Arc/MetJ-type ribon-helix-helix transcriptional regulator
MSNTQHLEITLPIDLALAVSAKVAAGEYVTESAAICAGLHLLLHSDTPGRELVATGSAHGLRRLEG